MRRALLVTYDICEPKRLRRVYRLMRGYGDHLQLSVFYCELSKREQTEMESRVHLLIQHDVDQVLVIDLGLADGRGGQSIRALGKAYVRPDRVAVIV